MGVRNLEELGINLQKIMNRLVDVERAQKLLKLLYYTSKDPYSEADLTNQQVKDEIFEKLVRITPCVTELDKANSLVVLKVNNGVKLPDNQEFRLIHLSFEVFVPLNQWIIKDSNLRPFAILGQLQSLLNGLRINGLGELRCGDFSLSLLTDEMSCYSLNLDIIEYD